MYWTYEQTGRMLDEALAGEVSGFNLPSPDTEGDIDLDLVAYGALTLRSGGLQVPHPRLAERRFVLQPLAEISPDAALPGLPPVLAMLAATEAQVASVQPISDAALSI